MDNLIETTIETVINKMKSQKKEGKVCFCNECVFNEMQRLTDEELYDIIKNYDANFME